MNKVNFFWFRRDLRISDNAGLYHILKNEDNVIPLFIFDKSILDKLEHEKDARVELIYDSISELKKQLKALGKISYEEKMVLV